jgi:hypothetical protein
MSEESIVIDNLLPQEIPVRLGGKAYTLRELTEGAHVIYRSAMLRGAKFDEQGKPRVLEGVPETVPLLVSLCLFDEENRPVPLATVKSWPKRVVQTLYNRAQAWLEVRGDDLKNSSRPTPGTSASA